MTPEPFNLEDALRQALGREEPGADFASRVLRRVAERRRRRIVQTWMAVAAMLILGILIASGVRSYRTQQVIAARKAGRELAIALKITGGKLQATQKMIRRRTHGV